MATLTGVKCSLAVALVCASPVTDGHLCVFFGEVPTRTLYPFLNWVLCYFLVELRESFYNILDVNPFASSIECDMAADFPSEAVS